jgi:PEGA domain
MKIPITFCVCFFAFSAFPQCSQNSECKSGRICYNGECTDPSAVPTVPVVSTPAAPDISKPIAPVISKPMAPVLGQLMIFSVPDQARIILDGKETGKLTPVKMDSVHEGMHQVSVFKGPLAAKDSIKVVPNTETSLNLQLVPGSGTLKISTAAANALVELDGAQKGTAPVEMRDVAAGKHEVRIIAKGYMPFTDSVSIDAGQSLAIHPKRMERLCVLQVNTVPPKANITVNGGTVKLTPYTQTDMMPATCHLTISCDTYRDTSLQVPLELNNTSNILIKLIHTAEAQKKIDHKRFVIGWTFRGVAGGVAVLAIGGGLLENSTAQNRYSDYRAINTVGDHSNEFSQVTDATTARNALYIVSGILLAACGISFAF